MTCLEVQDQLSGYVAKALGESAREPVQGHLAACTACRESEARIRKAWDFLEAMEPPPLPLDLAGRVKSARGELAPEAEPPSPPHPPKSLALRAGLLIALALAAGAAAAWKAGLLKPPAPDPASVPYVAPAPPPPVPWEGGAGVLRLLGVPDASVWAAPGSRGDLSYRGALRVESGTVWGRPDPDRPLRLEAAGWKATVLRGSFSASVTGDLASLTCHEGFLRIEPPSGEPLAVPEGTAVLLADGKVVGPMPARAIYPGDRQ